MLDPEKANGRRDVPVNMLVAARLLPDYTCTISLVSYCSASVPYLVQISITCILPILSVTHTVVLLVRSTYILLTVCLRAISV